MFMLVYHFPATADLADRQPPIRPEHQYSSGSPFNDFTDSPTLMLAQWPALFNHDPIPHVAGVFRVIGHILDMPLAELTVELVADQLLSLYNHALIHFVANDDPDQGLFISFVV